MNAAETNRVNAVKALEIVGSVAEPEFDRLARLAGHVAHADYAHVCFIDDVYQFAKATSGMQLPQLTPKDDSICIDVVDAGAPVVIEDLAADPRPKCRKAYEDLGFASYVGVPIWWTDGSVVGAVSALSFEKGRLSPRRLAALEECAGLVARELLIRKAASEEVRRPTLPAGRQALGPDLIRAVTRNHLNVLKSVRDGVIVVRANGVINFVNPSAEQILSRTARSLLGSTFAQELHVSIDGHLVPETDCPVAWSLRDGHERLARLAYFSGAERSVVPVEYAVSPIAAGTEAVGVIVVFRRLAASTLSNGVELRETLREVSKLKEQIARLELARAKAETVPSVELPDLRSGPALDFEELLQVIRDEQEKQSLRAQACGSRLDGPAGGDALLASTPFAPGRQFADWSEARAHAPSRSGAGSRRSPDTGNDLPVAASEGSAAWWPL